MPDHRAWRACSRTAQTVGDEIHQPQPCPGGLGAGDLGRQHQGRGRDFFRGIAFGAAQPPPCQRRADEQQQRQRDRGRAQREGGTPRGCARGRLTRDLFRCVGFGGGVDRLADGPFRRRVDDPRRRDPAEAEARHGADRVLHLAVVAHRAPRAQHDLADLRIGHVAAPEHRLRQLVAADRAFAVHDEILQAVERARRQHDRRTVARELAGRGVEQERPEDVRPKASVCLRHAQLFWLAQGACRQRRAGGDRPSTCGARRQDR
jgi:hypothetical protein